MAAAAAARQTSRLPAKLSCPRRSRRLEKATISLNSLKWSILCSAQFSSFRGAFLSLVSLDVSRKQSNAAPQEEEEEAKQNKRRLAQPTRLTEEFESRVRLMAGGGFRACSRDE